MWPLTCINFLFDNFSLVWASLNSDAKDTMPDVLYGKLHLLSFCLTLFSFRFLVFRTVFGRGRFLRLLRSLLFLTLCWRSVHDFIPQCLYGHVVRKIFLMKFCLRAKDFEMSRNCARVASCSPFEANMFVSPSNVHRGPCPHRHIPTHRLCSSGS